MHELTVTRELVRQVVSVAAAPKEVVVELGGLTTYKPEPLQYYFEALKGDFPQIAAASLTINEVQGRIKCKMCDKEYNVAPQYVFMCPKCSSLETEVVAGKDLILKRVIQ